MPYAIDSSFGRRLADHDVHVLDGYHILAAPIVSAMKASNTASSVIAMAVRPWVEEMMFESGFRAESSILGWGMMKIGLRIAKGVGLAKHTFLSFIGANVGPFQQWNVIQFVGGSIFIVVLVASQMNKRMS
jgi:hypothetical protein